MPSLFCCRYFRASLVAGANECCYLRKAREKSRRALELVTSTTSATGTFFNLATHSHATVRFFGSFVSAFTGACGSSISISSVSFAIEAKERTLGWAELDAERAHRCAQSTVARVEDTWKLRLPAEQANQEPTVFFKIRSDTMRGK